MKKMSNAILATIVCMWYNIQCDEHNCATVHNGNMQFWTLWCFEDNNPTDNKTKIHIIKYSLVIFYGANKKKIMKKIHNFSHFFCIVQNALLEIVYRSALYYGVKTTQWPCTLVLFPLYYTIFSSLFLYAKLKELMNRDKPNEWME